MTSIGSGGNAPFIASTRAKVANFVLFQAVWAACVLGAAEGMPWLGVWAGLAALPVHLAFLPARERGRELALIAMAGAAGTLIDSTLLGAGAIGFPEHAAAFPATHPLGQWAVPPWIIVLWCAVGSMLRSSLAWLGRDLRLAVALSAVTGPLSFLSGARLGATLIPAGNASLAALSVEYAVVLPILLWIARRSPEPDRTLSTACQDPPPDPPLVDAP